MQHPNGRKVAFGLDHIYGFFYQEYDWDYETPILDLDSTKGLDFQSLMDKIEPLLKMLDKKDREEIEQKLRREIN